MNAKLALTADKIIQKRESVLHIEDTHSLGKTAEDSVPLGPLTVPLPLHPTISARSVRTEIEISEPAMKRHHWCELLLAHFGR